MSEITCEEVLKEVELLLDGELDPERASHLRRHLTGCNPCLDRAEFQQKLRDIIRSKVRCDVPDHLELRVRQAIKVEGVSVQRRDQGPRPAV